MVDCLNIDSYIRWGKIGASSRRLLLFEITHVPTVEEFCCRGNSHTPPFRALWNVRCCYPNAITPAYPISIRSPRAILANTEPTLKYQLWSPLFINKFLENRLRRGVTLHRTFSCAWVPNKSSNFTSGTSGRWVVNYPTCLSDKFPELLLQTDLGVASCVETVITFFGERLKWRPFCVDYEGMSWKIFFRVCGIVSVTMQIFRMYLRKWIIWYVG